MDIERKASNLIVMSYYIMLEQEAYIGNDHRLIRALLHTSFKKGQKPVNFQEIKINVNDSKTGKTKLKIS